MRERSFGAHASHLVVVVAGFAVIGVVEPLLFPDLTGRRPRTALTAKAMTVVPTMARARVTPIALSCSIQSVLPTMSLEVGVEVGVDVGRRRGSR